MNEKEYLLNAQRTLSTDEDVFGHMVIGLSTEAGELLDAYKKAKFYGRQIDVKNIREEIGDCLWYLVQLANEFDYTLEEAMIDNIIKLQKRYPDKFQDVVERNQEVELSHIDDGDEDIVNDISVEKSFNKETKSSFLIITLKSKAEEKKLNLFGDSSLLDEFSLSFNLLEFKYKNINDAHIEIINMFQEIGEKNEN